MTVAIECIEIESSSPTQQSVIWLHGLGADATDFVPVVSQLNIPNTRFIFPNAPYQPISMNNGYEMRAWFDIYGLQAKDKQDELGIRAMQTQINLLIDREIERGVPSERIVLAGFSQGGAMAIFTALRYSRPLAGLMALSTYVPLKNSYQDEMNTLQQMLPIFFAHGTFDKVITIETAKASADLLDSLACRIEWHEYPIAHGVSKDEIDDIRVYLKKVLRLV
jgi:phospholipase/carboxylesterase